MAPPGIMSLEEHLGNIGMPFRNSSSTSAFKFSSSFSSYPINFTSRDVSKGSVPSVFLHDHDYVSKLNKHFFDSRRNVKDEDEHGEEQQQDGEEEEEEEEIDIDCSIDFEDAIVFSKERRRSVGDATSGVSNAAVLGSENNDIDSSAFNQTHNRISCATITTTSTHTTASCASVSDWTEVDTGDEEAVDDSEDMFHGLDELDFDLDEFDPVTDMTTEDTFQNFIDETLNDSLSHLIEEDTQECDGHSGEDTHKKEFFFKLLGLQAMPQAPEQTIPSFDSCSSHSFALPAGNHHMSYISSSHSTTLCASNNMSDVCADLSSFESTCLNSETNMDADAFSGSCVTSVPAKVCSRCAGDWKNSPLYSTASIYAGGRVQTHLSTFNSRSHVDTSVKGCSAFNDASTPYHSGSLTGSQNDHIDPFHSHVFPTSSVPQIGDEQDTNTTDELLQWLEENENFSPSAHVSTSTSEGSSNMCHLDLSAHYHDVPSPAALSPSTVQSISEDLDSFIDLEEYTAEGASPSSAVVVDNKDNINSQLDHNNGHVTDVKFVGEPLSNSIQSKRQQNSELRFRLSLLDELSKGFMDDRNLEKKGFSGHSLCGFTPEMGNSPLSPSPYSPSSKSSADDNLDLLGLFSDENSSMLIG